MSETAVVQKTELLQVADAVAREKAIDREQVLAAMEQAIQKAGCSKYGQEHDIFVQSSIVAPAKLVWRDTSKWSKKLRTKSHK